MISARIMRQGPVYAGGLVLIGLSGAAYITQSSIANKGSVFPYFMFCYSLVIAFMVMRRLMRNSVEDDRKIFHRTLLLTLFLISSYSLNEGMELFAPSVIWFRIVLIGVTLNLLLYAYWQFLPHWTKKGMSLINGVGIVVFLYLSLYLLPGYPLAGLLLPVLGVSFHLFVPLFLLIHSYRLQSRVGGLDGRMFYFFLTGLLLSLSICVAFALKWSSAVNRLNTVFESAGAKKDDLNQILNAAQYISPTAVNVSVLEDAKNEWVRRNSNFDIFSLGLFTDSDGNIVNHDPLLQIALFIGGPLRISPTERMELLRLITNGRHERQERLWSGDDLKTLSVDTRIDIWPSCFLAYTDKVIRVGVDEKSGRSGSREAIYTFELPQGSVVTSLSLWVNGKEEKGILSTKEKADSAYQQIVGRERQDPSIVHWQEGNTVLVRVFPVTTKEPRQFRLGITSPLSVKGGKAVYNSIFFKGPDASRSLETISTQLHESVGGLEIDKDFVSHANQSYTRRGDCNPVFSLGFDTRLSGNCTYTYGGYTYKMLPYHEELEPVQVTSIYLDVNSAWQKEEFMALAALDDRMDVFIWDGAIERLTRGNAGKYWQKLSRRRFGLFPFYKIEKSGQSLVVTKNDRGYIDMEGLKGTDFYQNTHIYFRQSDPIRLFNLGGPLLPYQQSLVEYRRLVYEEGDLQILQNRIAKHNYSRVIENDNLIVIPQSGLAIYRLPETTASAGPDHLMRLFAYNAVMRLYGENMRPDETELDTIMQLARAANIVTPVSSLVVLESQDDYDRFDLKPDATGLGNAALVNQGAVPEPHEWVLLIGSVSMVIYYGVWRRRKKAVI